MAVIIALLIAAQDAPPQQPRELTELSLEELLDVPITSVSKKPQRLSSTAAAVTVITAEDIRRSGATTVPELLRGVPGVHVARTNTSKVAVGIRGFNDRYSNKLLVLMDGRTLYNPLFSGVSWEHHDLPLEDIDRIEVIRGPGSGIWGTNAVNGVINIIMKPADDTPGISAASGGGTSERFFASVRGGARAYARYFDRRGDEGFDDWSGARGGFRTDFNLSRDDAVWISGDYFDGRAGAHATSALPTAPYRESVEDAERHSGGNITVNWEHTFGADSHLTATLAYDRLQRESRNFGERRDTVEIEVRHHMRLFGAHDVVAGIGYRLTHDRIDSSFAVSLDPERETDVVFSVLLQDEIAIVRDRLSVTLCAKVEHNDYSGAEFLPSARAAWMPSTEQTFWLAASRAIRSPSRFESDARINVAVIPGAMQRWISIFGDEDIRAEELWAFEAGWRLRPADNLSLDVALFYNLYDDLQTTEPGKPYAETAPAPTHLVIPQRFDNLMKGRTWGAELSFVWRPFPWATVRGAYSLLRMAFDLDSESRDTTAEDRERSAPTHMAYLRLSLDLPHDFQLDLTGRYVDSLPALDVGSYVEADMRLSWRPHRSVELFIVGQNLVGRRHTEFHDTT